MSVPVSRRSAGGRIVLLALLFVASVSTGWAGQNKPHKHEAKHEIDRLEEEWRSAVLNTDANALSALLAEDYTGITASGTLQTKEEAVANLRTRRVHFTSLELSERKVRFYGSTALVTSIVSVQGVGLEGPVSGDFRYTHVWVRNPQGQWRMVSLEASRIRKPGEKRGQDSQTSSK